MSDKIKVHDCRECNEEIKNPIIKRHKCGNYLGVIERNKKKVRGYFEIVDWFSTRSSAGLIVEDREKGLRVDVYMSELFRYLKGKNLGEITFEEIRRGTAYGWRVIDE